MFGGIVAGYVVVIVSCFVGREANRIDEQNNDGNRSQYAESVIMTVARLSGTLLIIDIISIIAALASVIILPNHTLADMATLFDNMTNTGWMSDHGSSRVFYENYGFTNTLYTFEFLRSSLRLSDTVGFVLLSLTLIRIARERGCSLDIIIFRETRKNTGFWQLFGTIIMLIATAWAAYFSYMYECDVSTEASMYLINRISHSIPTASVLISAGREYMLFLTIFGFCLFLPALYSTETFDADQ